MTWRVWFTIGLSVLALAVVLGATAYPISERDHRPASAAFEIPDGEPFEVRAAITVDDELVLEVAGAETADGERYMRVVERNTTVERYQADQNATTCTRYVDTVPRSEQREELLREDPDEEIIDVEDDGDQRVIVTVADAGTAVEWDARTAATVVTTELRLAAYEPIDASATAAADRRVLAPQSGWYDGSESYRLTETAGEVRIDDSSDAIVAADVRWDETPGTRSYLHYLANRDATITKEISFKHRPAVTDGIPGRISAASQGMGSSSGCPW